MIFLMKIGPEANIGAHPAFGHGQHGCVGHRPTHPSPPQGLGFFGAMRQKILVFKKCANHDPTWFSGGEGVQITQYPPWNKDNPISTGISCSMYLSLGYSRDILDILDGIKIFPKPTGFNNLYTKQILSYV